MPTAIVRHRSLFGDEVIGHVTPTAGGWTFVTEAGVRGPEYADRRAAEAGLLKHADQRTGERVLIAAAVVAVVAHPVLYTLSQLL